MPPAFITFRCSAVTNADPPRTLTRERLSERVKAQGGDIGVLTRLLAGRYSCRRYRADPVPRAAIARILAAAQLTASWCNAQPWQTIVTEGDGTERFRKAMMERAVSGQRSGPDIAFPIGYEGVYGTRRRDAGWALYGALGIEKGDRAGSGRQMLENFRLFGAPHVLFLTTERDLGIYGVLDCGIYLGNLMLLLQAEGIASIAQGALASHAGFVREWFGIPDHRQLLVGMSFGYPDPAHPANGFRTTRADPDDTVQWADR